MSYSIGIVVEGMEAEDTFVEGKEMAASLAALDRLSASGAGVRLSSFLVADGGTEAWFDAGAALSAVRSLLAKIGSTDDDGALGEARDELEQVAEILDDAAARGVRFRLVTDLESW